MSLDGLRAWIGVVERKLTMRTRVFLVLVAIAIGGAGAALYLAIDVQNNSISKADLESAQSGAGTASLEEEVTTLKAEVADLRGEEVGSGGIPESGLEGGSSGSGQTPTPAQAEQLQKLLEQAEAQKGK